MNLLEFCFKHANGQCHDELGLTKVQCQALVRYAAALWLKDEIRKEPEDAPLALRLDAYASRR